MTVSKSGKGADRSLALLKDYARATPSCSQPIKHSSSARLPLPGFYAGGEFGERPGRYPFTRGIADDLYREEPWVMGMYSGYASPAETNRRFKRLLEAGQTGLSVALDLPTQIGVDSDHPTSLGEVGKVGVPLNSVDDMLTLLDGLPLHQVQQMRTTANAMAPIFAAFALVALEELGIDPASFRLFLQNDPLKEYSARGTWIFPPRHGLKLAVDVIEYFAKHHPNWQPIQFCGYHVRDAGGSAIQEIGIATANGLAYLEEAAARGVDIARLAPSLFLFLSAGVDIFEEAAKLRAARRLWARLLHERFEVPEEAAAIKIFAYTLGGALTAREPQNNIARVAYEALAAALGGVQTLATSSWDEALGLPSEEAAHLSLRTQQVLAYEAGVTQVVDPLGGSHYVEAMTDGIEAAAAAYTARILELGGAVATIDSGFLAAEIEESAYAAFREVSEGRRQIVGVNYKPATDSPPETPPFVAPPGTEEQAVAALLETRARRQAASVKDSLEELRRAAAAGENCMVPLVAAARARATIGEMTETLAAVYGRHEPAVARHVPAAS